MSADETLEGILNLSRFHREHERFYARAPLEQAIALQRASRTLKTLAGRSGDAVPDPEVEGEPVELGRLRRDLTALADDHATTGAWLAEAMEASWEAAAGLHHPGLADLLGERHRIVANDWQAAGLSTLLSRLVRRAVDLLAPLDLTPAGVRADRDGSRSLPGRLYSAWELLDRAADLAAESAGLVNDNERRWRVFHARVAELLAAGSRPAAGVTP